MRSAPNSFASTRPQTPDWSAAGSSCLGTAVPHRPWPARGAGQVPDGSLVVSSTSPRSGVVVLRAIGEIDLLTAPSWARMGRAACRLLADRHSDTPEVGDHSPVAHRVPAGSAPAGRLVCDLSAVGFLGASGLAVLVELAEETAAHGLVLSVVADTRAVRRPLSLTGLDRRVSVVSALSEAVADPRGVAGR